MLELAFPKSAAPKKEWVSQQAWSLVEARRPLRKASLATVKEVKLANVGRAFFGWRAAVLGGNDATMRRCLSSIAVLELLSLATCSASRPETSG